MTNERKTAKDKKDRTLTFILVFYLLEHENAVLIFFTKELSQKSKVLTNTGKSISYTIQTLKVLVNV